MLPGDTRNHLDSAPDHCTGQNSLANPTTAGRLTPTKAQFWETVLTENVCFREAVLKEK